MNDPHVSGPTLFMFIHLFKLSLATIFDKLLLLVLLIVKVVFPMIFQEFSLLIRYFSLSRNSQQGHSRE